MLKLKTPDYVGQDPEIAMDDFRQRRKNYEKNYETIEDHEGPYVKVHDCKKFVIHNVRGYLPMKVVNFIMNLHTLPRRFYMTRHGQSEYNTLGKIGGDSGLSKAGIAYAKKLAVWAEKNICTPDEESSNFGDVKDRESGGSHIGNEVGGDETESETRAPKKQVPCRLWTSSLRRTQETAQFIEHPKLTQINFDNGDVHDWIQMRPMIKKNLDELYAGDCDGMTYKEIEIHMPDVFLARQGDKLAYRYPKGESYLDIINRLEPLALEMERVREPVLIIGHQGILRILYSYFAGYTRDEAPFVSIPLNHVIELRPHAYGCDETKYEVLSKEEMASYKTKLADGQDEPVTSQPMASLADGVNSRMSAKQARQRRDSDEGCIQKRTDGKVGLRQ